MSLTESIRTFVQNPYIGLVGIILAVVGLLFGVYQWSDSKIYPHLAFYVSPSRTIIVQTGTASDLAVTFRGRTIEGNLSAVQMSVWNGGKGVIRTSDILEPIYVSTGDGSPILEAKIVKEAREVSKIKLDETNAGEGRISLSWNILEQDDGAVIQLIYAGDRGTPIALNGTVQGQKTITRTTTQGKPLTIWTWLFYVIFVPGGIIGFSGLKKWWSKALYLILITFMVLFLVLDILQLVGVKGPPNPLPL